MSVIYARLNASTRTDRHESMALIRETFAEHSGWILDVHLFSNISVNFNFEIELSHLFDVVGALEERGVKFNRRSHAFLDEQKGQLEGQDIPNSMGTLQVTFIHNDPDLRQVIPAVPG